MSRIGKQPIEIPQGVKVVLSGDIVTVNGPGGNVAQAVHKDMTVKIEGQTINVLRKDDTEKSKGLHGLTRTLIANMVIGAKDGFEKKVRARRGRVQGRGQGRRHNPRAWFQPSGQFKLLKQPQDINYDYLVISLGADICWVPERVVGFKEGAYNLISFLRCYKAQRRPL